jgi:hypothetical protein
VLATIAMVVVILLPIAKALFHNNHGTYFSIFLPPQDVSIAVKNNFVWFFDFSKNC